jgi:hypothetical protein
MTTPRVRPPLPWYLEADVHDENPFNGFTTPAAVMAYVHAEIPEVLPDLITCTIGAGAGGVGLLYDVIELARMGHNELAELVMNAAEFAPPNKSMSEMDFMPESMRGADEILLRATAAIIRLKVKERCEGISVYERED